MTYNLESEEFENFVGIRNYTTTTSPFKGQIKLYIAGGTSPVWPYLTLKTILNIYN